MKNLCLMLILVPAVLGCAAGSQASIAVGVQSASCDIRPVYSHGILSLDGEVFGKPGETGIYRFVLNRKGAGGSSDVQQSGDYVIAVENAHGIASCEAGNIP